MIDILLATYNGARFLPEQLDSLFAQTFQDFRITALDDASTDGTRQVLEQYARQHPYRLQVQSAPEHTGNPSLNFFQLLAASTGDYVMFCDQDDVWLPDKVHLSLAEMHRLEGRNPERPLLIHTDLSVVSEDLRELSSSFMRYQHLDPARHALPHLIVQNNVTGCTMLINRALRERLRVPEPVYMHDWWIALTASALGEVGFLPQPTVLYRQHQRNVIGARRARSAAYAVDRLRSGSARDSLRRTYALAHDFLRAYRGELDPAQEEFLRQYSRCGSYGPFTRMRVLTRHHAYKKGIGRKLAQIFLG